MGRKMEVAKLARENGGYWDGEHPTHTVATWRHEVREGNTRQGYWEWALNCVDSDHSYEELQN